ncbi:MAG: glycosyl transferase, partial [Thermoanaerobaculia bacterium]
MTVRVALVGPVPPWRSGIADQTLRLARAMKALGVEPRVFTFCRMYPGFLYPGKREEDFFEGEEGT